MTSTNCEHRRLLNAVGSAVLSCLTCGYELTRSDFHTWLGVYRPLEIAKDLARPAREVIEITREAMVNQSFSAEHDRCGRSKAPVGTREGKQ